MIDNDIKRISRLTSILLQLQGKRVTTSKQLAEKFGVSTRTIYRDIRTLEQAGVPVVMEEGKGYSLMDGYRLPPIMFTDDEANALITAEKLVLVNTDVSFIKHYSEAVSKIRAAMGSIEKDHSQFLSSRVQFWQDPDQNVDSSNLLSTVQTAITGCNLLKIEYSSSATECTSREIEPFAVINKVGESWYLIAWCRLRNDYRLFRFDRILTITVTDTKFVPRKMSLQEYLDNYRKNSFDL